MGRGRVYDKSKPEVVVETEVTSAGRLVGGHLSMEDVVHVRIHETSLQMQVSCCKEPKVYKNSRVSD